MLAVRPTLPKPTGVFTTSLGRLAAGRAASGTSSSLSTSSLARFFAVGFETRPFWVVVTTLDGVAGRMGTPPAGVGGCDLFNTIILPDGVTTGGDMAVGVAVIDVPFMKLDDVFSFSVTGRETFTVGGGVMVKAGALTSRITRSNPTSAPK